VCDAKVQRIRYAANETNYWRRVPNRSKLLADRSLSLPAEKRLARTLEELEELKGAVVISKPVSKTQIRLKFGLVC